MRRSRRAFRPVVAEVLEDRAVPSAAGLQASAGPGLGGLFGSVPAQDAQQVGRAFGAFQRAYNQAVRSTLLPTGTTNPSANRPAFDGTIASALITLNVSIRSTVADLPNGPALADTIQSELIGPGANTLQSLLLAIPTPADLSAGAVRNLTRTATADINQFAFTVNQQVRSSQSPTTAISQRTVQSDLKQVQSAFRTFSQAYSGDVRTILLPPGTTDPSAHRAAFDRAVGEALTRLNSSIATALGNLPSSLTATLDATVRDDLLSTGSTPASSLQARLVSLPSPTSTLSLATRAFQFSSTLTINSAQSQVNRDILVAVSQYSLKGA